jgi:hypothetical protein
MKKKSKHPKDMTADEAIEHVFHPKALEHIKKHAEKLSEKQSRPKKNGK